MRKKSTSARGLALFIALIILTLFPASLIKAEERQVTVYLNGQQIHLEQNPLARDGIVYVPLRAVFEAQGATVSWDSSQRIIKSTKGERNIEYMVDKGKMVINGIEVSTAPHITYQQRQWVPLRFISQALGNEVTWNQVTYSVNIKSLPITQANALTNTSEEEQWPVLPPEISTTLKMNEETRSKTLYLPDQDLTLRVGHYGFKDGNLYSYLTFYNDGDQDYELSFEPGNKKLVSIYQKEREALPTVNLQDCTEVTSRVVIDNSSSQGTITRVPIFTENEACKASNQAEQQKNNTPKRFAFGETGSNVVTTSKYVQTAEGALNGFRIPANNLEQLIIVAPTEGWTHLVVNGSFRRSTDNPDTAVTFKLDYKVDLSLGFDEFSFIYTYFGS
ncbi:copper amine oxidase N-terminal domain-containing protein [Paenibacillus vini]|uniref:Copper amine oxidase-like N-terminal domain-containing protein n=1 Tax=Paenibacillus vini TaxID=1476024 RepID=A0ABQ4M9E8_9BACL|nr:copper amine oxidase N-terminal domain-containing protein [Paenibacillus vini]GIP52611.1 hypothetical protein J42TS3_16460 [Paenibacillus vini]